MKVYDPPEALRYLIDRGANGGKYVEDRKASMYGQSRENAEETYTEKCSTFWGDIRLRLEKATLAHLNTVILALGTEATEGTSPSQANSSRYAWNDPPCNE